MRLSKCTSIGNTKQSLEKERVQVEKQLTWDKMGSSSSMKSESQTLAELT